jgi:hypothetical protein
LIDEFTTTYGRDGKTLRSLAELFVDYGEGYSRSGPLMARTGRPRGQPATIGYLMNQACLIARQRSPELVTSAIRDRYSSAARCRKA